MRLNLSIYHLQWGIAYKIREEDKQTALEVKFFFFFCKSARYVLFANTDYKQLFHDDTHLFHDSVTYRS